MRAICKLSYKYHTPIYRENPVGMLITPSMPTCCQDHNHSSITNLNTLDQSQNNIPK